MAKCANCANNAAYSYLVTSSSTIEYCTKHLPAFLRTPKYAGRLTKVVVKSAPVVEEPLVVQEPAPTKASKKKTTPVVEEAPTEEPVIEEPVEVVEVPASEEVADDATN